MTSEDRQFITEQFTKVDARFGSLQTEMRDGFAKVEEGIEKLAISTQHEFARIGERFDALDGRIDSLAAKVTADHDFEIRTLRSQMDRVYQHLGLTERH